MLVTATSPVFLPYEGLDDELLCTSGADVGAVRRLWADLADYEMLCIALPTHLARLILAGACGDLLLQGRWITPHLLGGQQLFNGWPSDDAVQRDTHTDLFYELLVCVKSICLTFDLVGQSIL